MYSSHLVHNQNIGWQKKWLWKKLNKVAILVTVFYSIFFKILQTYTLIIDYTPFKLVFSCFLFPPQCIHSDYITSTLWTSGWSVGIPIKQELAESLGRTADLAQSLLGFFSFLLRFENVQTHMSNKLTIPFKPLHFHDSVSKSVLQLSFISFHAFKEPNSYCLGICRPLQTSQPSAHLINFRSAINWIGEIGKSSVARSRVAAYACNFASTKCAKIAGVVP